MTRGLRLIVGYVVIVAATTAGVTTLVASLTWGLTAATLVLTATAV